MATYTMNYNDGDTETVTADFVVREFDEYLGYAGGTGVSRIVARIPSSNVRSIIRTDDDTTPAYPHQDGDLTILGPDVAATADGDVIRWKGAYYMRDNRGGIG